MATTDERTTAEVGRLRQYAVVYLKGAFMGTADAVPGVSGGTIALIVGIYERLIAAITALDPRVLGHLPRLHTREGRDALAGDLVEMDVPFLLALGAGIFTALLLVSGAMHVAVERYPVPTYGFFFGLIAASAVALRDQVHLDEPRRVAAAVLGFTLAFVVAGRAESALPSSLPVLFVAGAIAITAMVLPGVSGAFFLLLLGQYDYMTELPHRLADGLSAALGGNAGELSEPLTILLVFGAGAAVGLLTVAHAIRYALEQYRAATFAFLVALMVGALRAPARRVVANLGASPADGIVPAVVAGVVGAGIVLVLDHFTDDIAY